MRVLTTARTVPSPQVSEVHVSSQMGSSFDYERLYGACRDRVLAISHFYAAFDGFHSADGRTIGDENGNQTPSAPLSDGRTSGDEVASRDQLMRSSARARADLAWWASIGTLLWSETAVVHAAAAAVRKQLRREPSRSSLPAFMCSPRRHRLPTGEEAVTTRHPPVLLRASVRLGRGCAHQVCVDETRAAHRPRAASGAVAPVFGGCPRERRDDHRVSSIGPGRRLFRSEPWPTALVCV